MTFGVIQSGVRRQGMRWGTMRETIAEIKLKVRKARHPINSSKDNADELLVVKGLEVLV